MGNSRDYSNLSFKRPRKRRDSRDFLIWRLWVIRRGDAARSRSLEPLLALNLKMNPEK